MAKKRVRRVRIKVPASTTNLGPGYDCLGLALKLYNYFDISIAQDGKVHISAVGAREKEIDISKRNLVYRSAAEIFRVCKRKMPALSIIEEVNIPSARGLGSSGSSVIGGMLAANVLCGSVVSPERLLNLIAAQEGHADNVTASFLGGLVIVARTKRGLISKKYAVPKWLQVVVIVPEYHLPTPRSRKALPQNVPHKDAVFNISRVPLVVDSLVSGNLDALRYLAEDRLHERYRRRLIRGFDKVVRAGLEAGAKAVVLSGAGPSIVAFCKQKGEKIGNAMSRALSAAGIANSSMILSPDNNGTTVESIEYF